MAEESSISIARVQAGAAVPARERALATAAILLAASGLGAASMFAKLAYGEGVGVTTLLFIRYIAAVLLLVPVVLLRRKRGALWTGALLLWAPAAVWYVTSAITFWSALRLGNVTQVAPVAYLYPAIVAVIGAVPFSSPECLLAGTDASLPMCSRPAVSPVRCPARRSAGRAVRPGCGIPR